MNKKQLLKNLAENVYCKLAPSRISGIGVFAIRDIPEGTDPFIGAPDEVHIKIKEQELKNIDQEVKNLMYDFFILQGDTFLVPKSGLNNINISYYLNHSKKPNMYASPDGNIMYALRDIKKGEELTINYSKFYGPENIKNFIKPKRT